VTHDGKTAPAQAQPDAWVPEVPEEPEARSRYDLMAEGYARWWGPVIRPGAVKVLEALAPEVEAVLDDGREPRLLDVGSGTGALAVAALERWPALRVTGIDPSGGMLEVAHRAAHESLPAGRAERFETVVAYADELPFDSGSFDVAVSSFVLQLVPNRAAALRETQRVLRPGGSFAWVAWQRSERPYPPDRIANEVLDDFGFEPPEADSWCGDVASPEAAALAMRRAGFRDVRAWVGEVAHPWDAPGYLDFLTQFDEESLFAELDPAERSDIERTILERLGRLTPEELTLRLPTVYAMGRAAS
jgi:SAM-dependent methyltransferase